MKTNAWLSLQFLVRITMNFVPVTRETFKLQDPKGIFFLFFKTVSFIFFINCCAIFLLVCCIFGAGLFPAKVVLGLSPSRGTSIKMVAPGQELCECKVFITSFLCTWREEPLLTVSYLYFWPAFLGIGAASSQITRWTHTCAPCLSEMSAKD